MNTERLLRVLRYARDNVKHPETPTGQQWPTIGYCDGVSVRIAPQPTAKSVREQLLSHVASEEARIKRLETYDQFVTDCAAIIAVLENGGTP